jgi:hypothetical protein
MKIRIFSLAPLFVLLCVSSAGAQEQFPVVDMVASKIVMKYQNSSCEQLWQERAQKQGKPKSPEEEKMIQILRTDQAMRAEFIDRIAAPIANKMFECGMIP